MILWFKHLPKISMDLEGWTPFIQYEVCLFTSDYHSAYV